MEAKVVADLASEEGMLAADKVINVNREAVQILEEVVSYRADVDAKCGRIKGRAICGAAESGVLEGLMGDVEEELLLHIHACALVLADAKVWLVEGQCVIEEVPVEGHARVGGDCEHCGKVIGVKPVQETWVHREAGIMRLALHECVPEGGDTIDAAGCTQADTDSHNGLKCSGAIWALGAGAWCVGGRWGGGSRHAGHILAHSLKAFMHH